MANFKILDGVKVQLTSEEEEALKIEKEQKIKKDEEYLKVKYKDDRRYPPIGDQLDEIYHNGIDEWKKIIKVVKDAHPKP